MKATDCRTLVLVTFVLAMACNGRGPTTPTSPPPASRPPQANGEVFEVTGVVTDDRGTPMQGVVVTMAHWLGGHLHRPSVVTDASGAYRISATATPLMYSTGRFLARAEIVADGYEQYWRSLIATTSSIFIESFRLQPIVRITAGNSMIVSIAPDVGDCQGWVAEVCGMVRVTVPQGGNLRIEAISTESTSALPPLEVCCAAGHEQYGNPVTITVTAGTELHVNIGLTRRFTTTQSFVLKTSFETF